MPVREDQLVEQLMPDFFHKQNPGAAWMHACSVIQALPGLRAFYPMSGFDSIGDTTDFGGLDHHLTYNGNPTYNYDNLVPYIDLDGTGDFLSHVDHASFDILGTETYVASAVRGLTCGGWIWVDASTGANQIFMGKFTGAGVLRSYQLYYNNASQFPGFVINDTIVDGSAGTTGTISTGQWYHIVGRFDPSTELKIYLNGNSNTNVAAIPAAANNTAADFTIGASGVPGEYVDGRESLCWICAEMLSDDLISALYRFMGPMYGHKV